MRGYPQFSFCISITLVKIYISCIIINRGKNAFELVGTDLKVKIVMGVFSRVSTMLLSVNVSFSNFGITRCHERHAKGNARDISRVSFNRDSCKQAICRAVTILLQLFRRIIGRKFNALHLFHVGSIEVSELDGSWRRTLIAGDIMRPSSIALDPSEG